MNPTSAGIIPNDTAACCTDSTNTSLTVSVHGDAPRQERSSEHEQRVGDVAPAIDAFTNMS